MNKADYLAQVEGLHASPELRARIAELAGTVRPRRRLRPWMGACACLALIVGLGVGLYTGRIPLPGGNGGGGAGHSEGSTFLSYAGPVFPLTLAEENAHITARREVTLDFAPWEAVWVEDPESDSGGYARRTTDVLVTDSYTLTNSSQEDQTVSVLYPFSSALYQLGKELPVLRADGAELETALRVGAYSGGFEGVWNGAIGGGPEGSVNLDYAESWEDYQTLLSDGTYLQNALGTGPDVRSIPVTVYQFTDPYGPPKDDEAGIPNPTLRASFDLDYDETIILSWGFHGGSFDRENGRMIQSFSIPQPGEPDYGEDVYYLLVVGEDIENLTTGGYVTGGADPDTPVLEGCGVTVERYESDLDTVLRELLEPYWEGQEWEDSYGKVQWKVDFETWYRAFLEYLLSYGNLSPDAAERYGAGLLESIAGDVSVIDRVCWLETQLTVPAGGSVELTASLTKEASFDYGCAQTENLGVYGYDLVTRLGSNLTCTAQTATLLDRGQIEIVRQNFGFDLENGITTVPLDPGTEHYYLEVRRAS